MLLSFVKSNSRTVSKALKCFAEFTKSFLCESTVGSADVLLFCHDNDRSLSLYGKAYSPLIDSLREELELAGLSCVSIAYPHCKLYLNKGFGAPVSSNKYYFCSSFCRRLAIIAPALASWSNPYNAILRTSNCSLVVSIGAPPALCEAARNNNVMHAELLHGIGYPFVEWGWDVAPNSSLPQAILSLDKISTKTFSLLKNRGVKIFEIPHPFLRKFLPQSSYKVPEEWCFKKLKISNDSKHILVSLQWGYAEEPGSPQFFSGILKNGFLPIEVLELIEENLEICWHIRLHPVQLLAPEHRTTRENVNSFCKKVSNAEWIESSIIPLPLVVQRCDLHITMSSMTSYDAAYFGIPTLAMCPTLQDGQVYNELFSDLVSDGYLSKVLPNKNAISRWISESTKLPPRDLITNKADSLIKSLNEVLKLSNLDAKLIK